jgi:hypothetical protein
VLCGAVVSIVVFLTIKSEVVISIVSDDYASALPGCVVVDATSTSVVDAIMNAIVTVYTTFPSFSYQLLPHDVM